jgi:signal transduction histidine kinase
MRRLAATLLLAIALGLSPQGATAVRAEALCPIPSEAVEAVPLAGTFAAIARGSLRIMVVGSASTASGGTSGPEAVWPMRLQARLSARLAPVAVTVVSHGGRGMTAADHLRIIEAEAPRFRPHLIVWQLGTVEAARGLPAEEMSDIVQDAAARLRVARGELTDLVLMDMQFSRFFRANANVEAYRDQLRIAAAASGAQLFSRWDLMRQWAESETLDLERAPREQRTKVADDLHDCIARALARFVLKGVGDARR